MKQEGFIDITAITAAEVLAAVRDGRASAEELVGAFLARIRADEPRVQAWAWIDEERALQQARNVDRIRREGHPIGPLHGLPVGVKDIVDTADMLAGRSNVNAASDLGVASLLAEAAARGATANVLVNLPSVEDEAFASDMAGRVDRILAGVAVGAQRIREVVASGEARASLPTSTS